MYTVRCTEGLNLSLAVMLDIPGYMHLYTCEYSCRLYARHQTSASPPLLDFRRHSIHHPYRHRTYRITHRLTHSFPASLIRSRTPSSRPGPRSKIQNPSSPPAVCSTSPHTVSYLMLCCYAVLSLHPTAFNLQPRPIPFPPPSSSFQLRSNDLPPLPPVLYPYT